MKAITFVCCLFVVHSALAQDITVQGKITDARTGKGVKASILYKSYPTGGITGRFRDSTFTFTIFGSSKYHITAEAEGYNPGTALVDPKDVDANHTIIRDLVLTKKGETIELDHLIFEQGKGVIDPKSFLGLDEVVAMMKEDTRLVIQLEGHTDNQGDAKKNMELSQDRVENVKKYLVSKGVAKDRVKTKAFGGTQPILNANTPEARKRNRRVEMRILQD